MRFAPDWDENRKIDYFGITCGRILSAITKTHDLTPVDSDTPFADMIKNIDKHFKGQSDPALDHQALLRCKQEATESAQDFLIRLSQLTRHKNVDKDFMRTHFVLNLRDKELTNLAVTAGWSLAETVKAAARKETLKLTSGKDQQIEAREVAAVGFSREPKRTFTATRQASIGRSGDSEKCARCGIKRHRSGVCPAKGKSCMNCNEIGHFSVMCRKPQVQRGQRRDQQNGSQPQRAREQINQLGDDSPWIICAIGGTTVRAMIDSGADVNAVSEDDWLTDRKSVV